MIASRNASALLNFEVARFGTLEKTVLFRVTQGCAILVQNLCLHSIGSPVKGSRQLCCRGVELKPIHYQLSALRCGQLSPAPTLPALKSIAVGAIIDRPFATVSVAPTGRADAKTVSVPA